MRETGRVTTDPNRETRPLQPSRRSQVPPFEVMDVLDRVAVLRAQGRDVVSLCAGEPSGVRRASCRRRRRGSTARGAP